MAETLTINYEITRNDFDGIMALMSMNSPEIARKDRDELWQKALTTPIEINALYDEKEQDKLAQLKFTLTALTIACVVKKL